MNHFLPVKVFCTAFNAVWQLRCGRKPCESIFKVTFVNSFQYHSYYLLHQFVVERGYAERSCLSVFFGMCTLLDGWGE